MQAQNEVHPLNSFANYLLTMIQSAWRPLVTVTNAPLLLCDKRTVDVDDLLEVKKIMPDRIEENLYLRFRSYHKWYWLSEQKPDEVYLFTSWNSTKHSTCAGKSCS